MSKKNKGGSKAKRANANLVQQVKAEVEAAERERIAAIYNILVGMTFSGAHDTLVRSIIGLEKTMADEGYEPQDISNRFSGNEFTPCRKCAWSKPVGKDDAGVIAECQVFVHSDGVPLRTCRTDGCSFGRTR